MVWFVFVEYCAASLSALYAYQLSSSIVVPSLHAFRAGIAVDGSPRSIRFLIFRICLIFKFRAEPAETKYVDHFNSTGFSYRCKSGCLRARLGSFLATCLVCFQYSRNCFLNLVCRHGQYPSRPPSREIWFPVGAKFGQGVASTICISEFAVFYVWQTKTKSVGLSLDQARFKYVRIDFASRQLST